MQIITLITSTSVTTDNFCSSWFLISNFANTFTGKITTSSCAEKTQRAHLSHWAVFLFKQRVTLQPRDCRFPQKTGLIWLHTAACLWETPFFRSHWSQPKQIEHQQPRCTEKWQSCYDLVTVDVGRGGWASWFYLLCTLWVDVDLTKKGARNPNSVRKANWTEAKNALSHIRFSPQVIRLCMLLIWLAGDIWENVLRTNVAEY